jgi:excisionase family DNA binding protein
MMAVGNELLLKFLQATAQQQEQITAILDRRAPQTPNGPLLLGMKASAALLGVSRPTLWRMLRAGKLKKVEVLPGSYRIRRADLESLVAGQEVA